MVLNGLPKPSTLLYKNYKKEFKNFLIKVK